MRISVCIATHNGADYIENQIHSILPQLGMGDEIIVSDDGSTDDTPQKVLAISDSRIKLFRFTHKSPAKFPLDYPTHNFVNAMDHATGDVIFLSDQDDVWLPGHVSLMTRLLDEYHMVVCDCKITDENLQIQSQSKFCSLGAGRGIMRNLWSNVCYQGSCMAFRREVFEKARPFPAHYVGHDLWLGLIAESYFRVTLLHTPLLLYRRRSDSITFTGKKNTNSLWFKLHYRFFILKELVKKRNC